MTHSPAPRLLDELRLDLFADVFQFTIADGRGYTCEPSPQWIESLMAPQMLAMTQGVIAVGTVRDMTVPVVVQRWDAAPADDLEPYDQVADAAIEVRTGRLVVMGTADFPPHAAQLHVPAGTYQAQIYYTGLDTISDDGMDGDDTYRIALWPGAYRPISIIKQH